MKPRRYIVHVEAGPSGDLAWHEAMRRARHTSAVLVAIRAVPRRSWFQQRHRSDVQRSTSVHLNAWKALAARAEAVAGTVDVEISIVDGDPTTEIVRAADQHDAELIVLGPASVEDALFGSVANRTMRRARCAVLVVRETRETGVIMGGTDFSDATLPVVATTCAEAIERPSGRPIVAHSLEPVPAMACAAHRVQSVADDVVLDAVSDAMVRLQRVVQKHPPVEPMIIDGPAGPALVAAASKIEADLLVVGTIGRTGLSHLVLGNVAEHVMRCAPCSVLVVRLHR